MTKRDFFNEANRTSADFYTTSYSRTYCSTLSSTFRKTHRIIHTAKKKDPNFHHKILRDKLFQSELYQQLEANVKNNFFLTDRESRPRTNSIARPPLAYRTNGYIPICTQECLLYGSATPRIETVSDFIQKTNNLRRGRIIQQVELERKRRIEEAQITKIQEYDFKIYSLKFAFRLLSTFESQFANYIKFLNNEVEKNKTLNKEIYLRHSRLLLENKELTRKIESLKASINKGKTYKIFLLCVRFRVLKPEQLPDSILVTYQLPEYRKPAKSPILRRQSILPKRPSLLFQPRRSVFSRGQQPMKTIKDSSPTKKRKEETGNPYPQKIFKNVEEFKQDLLDLENKTLELFTESNDKIVEIERLKKERDDLIEYNNKKEKEEDKAFVEEEKMLEELKLKNRRLKASYKDLTSSKRKKLEKKIYRKVSEIINGFPFNVEKEYEAINLYQILANKTPTILIKGIKYNVILYCLSLIERTLLENISRFRELSSNIKLSMEINTIKNSLDLRKKIMNNQLKIKQEKERRERINQEIIQKFNRLLFVPNRKICITNYSSTNTNFMKKKRNVKKVKEFEGPSYDDVLIY